MQYYVNLLSIKRTVGKGANSFEHCTDDTEIEADNINGVLEVVFKMPKVYGFQILEHNPAKVDDHQGEINKSTQADIVIPTVYFGLEVKSAFDLANRGTVLPTNSYFGVRARDNRSWEPLYPNDIVISLKGCEHMFSLKQAARTRYRLPLLFSPMLS